MIIEPGIYREDLILDRSDGLPLKVSGYGAIFEGAGIQVLRSNVVIEGVTIRNAEVGLTICRGQNSRIENVNIEYCKTGVLFGHDMVNTQVAWSTYRNILCRWCEYGLRWDFGNSVKSWCNANSFDTVSLRHCDHPMHAVNPEDRINYNTFTNMQIEGGIGISVNMPHARQNTFVGGHFVDKDEQGRCSILGPFNHLFGGRYVGTIDSPSSQIMVGSGVKYEGGRFTQVEFD